MSHLNLHERGPVEYTAGWYRVCIRGRDKGTWSVESDSYEEAVSGVVRCAISSGWKPPTWWQFWLPKWNEDCKAEYERQIGEPA